MDWNQEKKAALDMLVAEGVDFDTAAQLVMEKSASIGSRIAGVGKSIAGDAAKLGDQLHNVRAAAKANGGVFNKGTGSTIKAVGKNKSVMAGAGGVATLGAGAYALGREKKAAVDMLVENGIDFDTATDLVMAKAEELFGR